MENLTLEEVTENNKIIAKSYNSEFEHAKGNYNGISAASDGKIYYVLCSGSLDVGAQMYSFDPKVEEIKHLGDLTEVCGEGDSKAVPQGKSHVDFSEYDGRLFFGTHTDYYKIDGHKELVGIPPEGYNPYPGGHVLSYNIETGMFEDYCIAPNNEGILAMSMDKERGRLYCLTWPTGYVFSYDVPAKQMKVYGKFSGEGELGTDTTFHKLCRSITIDQRTGNAFFTRSTGTIFCINYENNEVQEIKEENLIRDYFGCLDMHGSGIGYQWREAIWVPKSNKIYGVMSPSNYLVSYCTKQNKLTVLDRLTSMECRRKGSMKNHGTGLCLSLSNDGNTLFFPTASIGDKVEISLRSAGKITKYMKGYNTHLVSYNIEKGKTTDHGEIVFENGKKPIYINSLTVGMDGTLYALCYLNTDDGKTTTDLVAIHNPVVK